MQTCAAAGVPCAAHRRLRGPGPDVDLRLPDLRVPAAIPRCGARLQGAPAASALARGRNASQRPRTAGHRPSSPETGVGLIAAAEAPAAIARRDLELVPPTSFRLLP